MSGYTNCKYRRQPDACVVWEMSGFLRMIPHQIPSLKFIEMLLGWIRFVLSASINEPCEQIWVSELMLAAGR